MKILNMKPIFTNSNNKPGNSGGPLLNDDAWLIGVNVRSPKSENINFAIAVDEVKKFMLFNENGILKEEIIKPVSIKDSKLLITTKMV